MENNIVDIGEVSYKFGKHSVIGYQLNIHHRGLNEHKTLSAPEKYLLALKVNLQIQKWNQRWNREVNFEDANLRTEEAKQALEEIEKLLVHTLSIDDSIQWHKLKDRNKNAEKNPKELLEGILSNLTKPIKGTIKPIPL